MYIQEIDLEDTITTIIDGFSFLLEKNSIKLHIDVKDAYVYVDVFEMEIVIKNFISNAMKHTPFGRTLIGTFALLLI